MEGVYMLRSILNRVEALERRYMPVMGVFAIIKRDDVTGQYYAENVEIKGCIPPPRQAEDVAQQIHNLNNPPPQCRILEDLIREALGEV